MDFSTLLLTMAMRLIFGTCAEIGHASGLREMVLAAHLTHLILKLSNHNRASGAQTNNDMRKMKITRQQKYSFAGRLKVQTNFTITDELREAIRLTRGVNYLVPNTVQKQFEIELEYAPLVGPAGTEKEIRATVKQFFINK